MSISQSIIDEAVGGFVLAAKNHFENQRRNAGYEAVWRLAENSYFNRGDDFYGGLSKVRIPFLHNKVETIVPKIDKALFPADGRWMEGVADNPEDDIQVTSAESAAALLRDQLRDAGIRTKYSGMTRSMCVYGTVWAKTKWEHILKKKYGRVNGERVTQWVSLFDGPDTYSPDIWDVYADIKDENLDGLVIERIVKDYQELWDSREREGEDGETIGVYRNVEQLREVKNIKAHDDSSILNSESTKGLALHEYGPHEHKLITYECWGPMPLWFFTGSEEDKKNKLVTEGFITIAVSGEKSSPTTMLIKDNPLDHQEKPYQRGRYIRVDGRLYGIGMMEPNVPMEAELNTLRNQLMDMRTFNLRPKWLLDTSARINHASLKDLAEQIIETSDINGLQPLRPNDFSASALANEQSIKSDLAETTGGSPLTAGFAGGNSIERTSIGVTTLASSALDRFDLVVTNFIEEVIRKQLKQMWALNQQFLPEGREVQVLGKPMIRVSPNELPFPKINFIGVQGGADKQFRINSANILIQNISPFAQLGLDPIPLIIEQMKLLGWGELVPKVDKRPTSEEMMEQTPEGEAQLLMLGRKVRIDFDDDHEKFIQVYDQLLANKEIPGVVKANIESARGQRIVAMKLKDSPEIMDAVINNRKMLGSDK
jgi:hypothetical protein